MNYKNIVEELINKTNNNIKEEIVIINNDNPIFDKKDYKILEGEPIYFELDTYGRSNGAIAVLSKRTIPLVIKKKLIYPNPYGWNTTLENQDLFERCHIIAYSLLARIADKKNIFIGTNNLNKSIMKKIENRVKRYINETTAVKQDLLNAKLIPCKKCN